MVVYSDSTGNSTNREKESDLWGEVVAAESSLNGRSSFSLGTRCVREEGYGGNQTTATKCFLVSLNKLPKLTARRLDWMHASDISFRGKLNIPRPSALITETRITSMSSEGEARTWWREEVTPFDRLGAWRVSCFSARLLVCVLITSTWPPRWTQKPPFLNES